MQKPTKALLTKLEKWHTLKAEAAKLAEAEKELRLEIFNMAFPKPEEGSKYNKLDLADGYVLQGDYKINRRVDEAALAEVQKKMDPVSFGRTFKFKPDLITAGFRDLDEKQAAIASMAVISSPGTPALSIVQKKK